MRKLPVTWSSNRTAWMNCTLFTNWLNDFDKMIGKQNRKILLFLDNAPVHPPDVTLNNITLKFSPANTTAFIQPMDQGVIRTFKAYYRRQLVQHVITNASTAFTADDVRISALDAVY
jgi:DDE superfamily endonuclease